MHCAVYGVLAAAFVALLSVAPAEAQEKPAEVAAALRDRALADPGGYRFVARLTTEIGQRLAGSEAMGRAAEWAQRELKEAGFDKVHAESFPITAWVRGAETGQILSPAPQAVALTALGGSVATPPDGIEAEIALFRSYAELLAAPSQSLAGKIAVVTQRMARTQDGSGYGAANPVRRAGPSEAARRGAVAYLLRSLGTDSHRLPHTGALNYAEGVARVPAAALANPDADQLERLAAQGPVKMRLVLTPSERANAQSWNVVGEVTGREHPDEIVLLGAHLDSWDLGTGAIDDAAGAAIVTAAGRLIAALPRHPKRTLRIVLFGAEEMDYSGPAYAKAHDGEAARIVIAGESDFGARKIYEARLPAGVATSAFGGTLADTLTPLGIFVGHEAATMGGDDIRPLHAMGVPVVSLRQNGIDYFDIHHTADDTLDKIDAQELAQDIAAWATFAYLAAESDIDFRAPK